MANLGKSVKGKSRAKKKTSKPEAATKAKVMEDTDYLKKMIEMNRRLLREKLGRELAMSRMNKAKVQNTWVKIMRLAKVDELRKDVEITSQQHERDVDRKDAVLQMLDRDLDESEEQYQLALRHHLRNVDKLIELQDERLRELETVFEKDLETVDKEFAAEREGMAAGQAKLRGELEELVVHMAETESEKMQELKQEYDTAKEETRNKHVERVNVLSAALDQQIEDLQRDFEAAHINYLHQTDTNTEEFKRMTRLDKAAAKSSEVKLRLITKYQRGLDEWKARMVSNARDYREKNDRLTEEKGAMQSHTKSLKDTMRGNRKAGERRLVNLSKSAAQTAEELKAKMELAERIMVKMERARALETEKEQVVPFSGSGVPTALTGVKDEANPEFKPLVTGQLPPSSGAESGSDSKLVEESKLTELESNLPDGVKSTLQLGELGALRNFHKKYNAVLLDKLTLDREKARLTEENAKLQSVLKQYLEGISVTNTAVDGENTLLVVNNRTSRAVGGLPVREAPPPVVEGNHMVSTGRAAGHRHAPL